MKNESMILTALCLTFMPQDLSAQGTNSGSLQRPSHSREWLVKLVNGRTVPVPSASLAKVERENGETVVTLQDSKGRTIQVPYEGMSERDKSYVDSWLSGTAKKHIPQTPRFGERIGQSPPQPERVVPGIPAAPDARWSNAKQQAYQALVAASYQREAAADALAAHDQAVSASRRRMRDYNEQMAGRHGAMGGVPGGPAGHGGGDPAVPQALRAQLDAATNRYQNALMAFHRISG